MSNSKKHNTKTTRQKKEYNTQTRVWNRMKNENKDYVIWLSEKSLSDKERAYRRLIINKNIKGDTSLVRHYAKKIYNIGKQINCI